MKANARTAKAAQAWYRSKIEGAVLQIFTVPVSVF